MAELADAGAVGFSDDGHPVADANMMRQALSYSSSLGLPIINHCEVPELSADGVMNEGWTANRLGLRGIPNACRGGDGGARHRARRDRGREAAPGSRQHCGDGRARAPGEGAGSIRHVRGRHPTT